ncbi:MAG TPA: hypothetical protein VE172_23485 [Stackebrandtia sp.]|jgi:hypothetical protein|uniref:hypothetical protein n=1 Tax=Stackebrandtia sp. TaxID=2023065 RepID=UPI002D503098|nr:hypothetical protein [Stackebrandtia sp.]HZE41773.1 hypothetical protein [Stackebrandtia sp.]
MTYPGQAPSFLPPAPPSRPSRAGGIILLLAGLLGVGAAFVSYINIEGFDQTISLKYMFDEIGKSSAPAPGGLDNPQFWFLAAVGAGGAAVLFGLIGLAGNKGVNITAGIFGLLAAIGMAYPPIWAFTGASLSDMAKHAGDILKILGPGYYMLTGGAFLALIGAVIAFIGSAKK